MKKAEIVCIIVKAFENKRYVHVTTKQGKDLNAIVSRWYNNPLVKEEVILWDLEKCKYVELGWSDISDVYMPYPKDAVALFAEVSEWEHVSAYITLRDGSKHHVQCLEYGENYICMMDLDAEKVIEVTWHDVINISKS